jgi:hypothetical protein
MIGPHAYRLPREDYSEELSFSANRPMVLELAERMGVPSARFRLDFFGGTMFWVRPEALKPLGDLRLSSAIPEEKGLLDGTLGHAIERVFSTSVLAAGYKLANSDATGVSDGGKPRPALDEEGWPIAARQSQITTDAAAREDDEFANPALQESAGEALSVDARPRSRRAPST